MKTLFATTLFLVWAARIFAGAASGSVAASNPTAQVGTSTINGSAGTYMRSDAAPAINQAMTPTMTGLWNFNADINMPATTSNKLVGVIQQAGVPIFHTYNGAPGLGALGQHIFIGPNCGNFTNNLADTNIGIGGYDSENLTTTTLASLTSGKENIAIGFGCLGLLTAGVGNCGVGAANSENVTTGSGNSAFGTNCFLGGTGSQNTMFGNLVAANMGGAASNNSLFGFSCGNGLGNTSNNNVGFGDNAIGKISTGSNNTAIGHQAGFGGTGVITFSNDVFVGAFAGQYEQTVSNEFFLNNQDRLTYTGDKTLSLLYGTFAATAAAQTLVCNGALTSSVSIGYPTGLGVGGTVTQATSRTNGVTLNTITGLITGNGSSLAASTTVTFTVTDSQVTAVDLPVLAIKSGAPASTIFTVSAVAAGSFNISETNTNTLTADTSVPLIKFSILKASEN